MENSRSELISNLGMVLSQHLMGYSYCLTGCTWTALWTLSVHFYKSIIEREKASVELLNKSMHLNLKQLLLSGDFL